MMYKPGHWLVNMRKGIKDIGVIPGDSAEVRLRKFTVLIISLTCSVAAPLWSVIYLLLGMKLAALGPVIYFVLVVPAIAHFVITKKENILVNVQLFAIFFCPAFMQ